MYEGSEWLEGWRFRNSMRMETERFYLHYPPAMKRKAEAILREAERVACGFRTDVWFPFGKTRSRLPFPDRKAMQRRFSWPPDQSATGVYYAGGIYLLDPEEWMGEPVARPGNLATPLP